VVVTLSQLLPGLVTLLLALFGGAGGAVVLEVWWKPWRTRRRVAALLAQEVNLNGQMITLAAHLLRRDPGHISPDFQLSRFAFDAVAQEIGELPATVTGHVILTYHHFDHLHRLLEMFRERTRRWREAEVTGRGDVKKLEHYVINALDAFTVGLDTALDAAHETFTLLRAIAPRQEWREKTPAAYATQVEAAEAARLERTKRLAERLERLKGDELDP